jgi:hypothetical protein
MIKAQLRSDVDMPVMLNNIILELSMHILVLDGLVHFEEILKHVCVMLMLNRVSI